MVRNEKGPECSQQDCEDRGAALDLQPEVRPDLEIARVDVGDSDNDHHHHQAVQAEEEADTELLAGLELHFPE